MWWSNPRTPMIIINFFSIRCCDNISFWDSSRDQLELTCTITDSGSLLVWNVTLIPENLTTPMNFGRTIDPSDPSDQTTPIMINSTMLTYSRISAQHSIPLISKVLISTVSNHLNGTHVNCLNGFTSQTSSVAVVNITNGNPIQGEKIQYYIVQIILVPVCACDFNLWHFMVLDQGTRIGVGNHIVGSSLYYRAVQ